MHNLDKTDFSKRETYNHNHDCLVEKYFEVVAKEKKSLQFEFVSVLSIFRHKNVVFLLKKKAFT